jgi:tRNA nucleotidyltransferase (CCA-adding enzyme)
LNLPIYIQKILSALENSGFEAYVVGGCVRDSLMGIEPHDCDITTSALPEQTERVFGGCKVIETGIKHGTVTVLCEGNPVEITTFRTDGQYLDGRHPESVSFTRSLSEDLSRRDFTVNGIAFSPKSGYCDLFGGREDIRRGIIRCIGDPDKRFNEDALRIMRALRFAAVLGFEIEERTSEAVRENRHLLEKVSAERIFEELKKLLCGKNAERVLTEFPEVFAEIIPELAPEIGYEQGSKYHDSTLWVHSARAVGAAESSEALRLAMLLHDIGKPACKSADENGECHYYGHAAVSAEMSDGILRRLKCSNALRERVCGIIRYHDMPIELSDKFIRRQLSRRGDLFGDILLAHIADDSAKKPECAERIPMYRQAIEAAARISAEKPCLTAKSLAVDGNDLRAIVEPSPKMGAILKQLLDEVIDGSLPNEKPALIERARELAGE